MASGEVNLLLRYKIGGESGPRFKGAARIRLDGAGCLTVTDARTGSLETIPLKTIELLSIQSVSAHPRPPVVM
jgi:hypothetical protein